MATSCSLSRGVRRHFVSLRSSACLDQRVSRKSVVARVKKDSDEKIYEQTEKVVADLKDKWNKTEEKPAAIGLTISALVALWVLNGVVGALDRIPVVSGVLELVGIFVTAWFVYRYLVFGPDREQLKRNLNEFWQKVQGKAKSVGNSGPKL